MQSFQDVVGTPLRIHRSGLTSLTSTLQGPKGRLALVQIEDRSSGTGTALTAAGRWSLWGEHVVRFRIFAAPAAADGDEIAELSLAHEGMAEMRLPSRTVLKGGWNRHGRPWLLLDPAGEPVIAIDRRSIFGGHDLLLEPAAASFDEDSLSLAVVLTLTAMAIQGPQRASKRTPPYNVRHNM